MQTPDELLGPFITAVAITLRELAGVEVIALDLTRAAGGAGPADVVVFLRSGPVAAPDGAAAARRWSCLGR